MPGGGRLSGTLPRHQRARALAVHPEKCPRVPVIHQGSRQLVPCYVATFSRESAAGFLTACVEAIMWVVDRPRATEGPICDLAQSASRILRELTDAHLTFVPGGLLKPRSTDGR